MSFFISRNTIFFTSKLKLQPEIIALKSGIHRPNSWSPWTKRNSEIHGPDRTRTKEICLWLIVDPWLRLWDIKRNIYLVSAKKIKFNPVWFSITIDNDISRHITWFFDRIWMKNSIVYSKTNSSTTKHHDHTTNILFYLNLNPFYTCMLSSIVSEYNPLFRQVKADYPVSIIVISVMMSESISHKNVFLYIKPQNTLNNAVLYNTRWWKFKYNSIKSWFPIVLFLSKHEIVFYKHEIDEIFLIKP